MFANQTQRKRMTDSKPSRILRAALFTLVTLAYLSMPLWQPANAYGKNGRTEIPWYVMVLMISVFLVSMVSWRKFRLVAALGLLAFILWLAAVLLPVT